MGTDAAPGGVNGGTIRFEGPPSLIVRVVAFVENVGPVGDKRHAAVPIGQYLNFGITDDYLGHPCNEPRAIKVCVDFYDDPAFATNNVRFGPEAYTTNEAGSVAVYPSDKRRSWRATASGCGVPGRSRRSASRASMRAR